MYFLIHVGFHIHQRYVRQRYVDQRYVHFINGPCHCG